MTASRSRAVPSAALAPGFTLLEVVVVLAVIGILTAVLVVKNPFAAMKMYAATRKVAADIRYAQQLAISTQTRSGLQYTGAVAYAVFKNDSVATRARAVGDSCSDDGTGDFVVDFSAPRCDGYAGVTLATTFPADVVKFDSLGAPFGGDDNALAAGANSVTLSLSGAASRTISIEPGTGRVRY